VRMHAGVEWMLWGLLWCQAKQPIEAAQELSKPHRARKRTETPGPTA
jgi:hypothetical protein